ncbi:MAG: hypothetical protein MZV64_16630 [Ignavibacteriales bacterium]|nr:hypothetical protein [Ignavibacteriales bacterium]
MVPVRDRPRFCDPPTDPGISGFRPCHPVPDDRSSRNGEVKGGVWDAGEAGIGIC